MACPARPASVAYFTMEVALDDALPTFSGGLGVLAGDYLRSCADLGLPVVALTLLYKEGYFDQRLDELGCQTESPVRWSPADRLTQVSARAVIEMDGRPVTVGAWRLEIEGATGHVVEVYFLDTDLEENDSAARAVTDRLYGGDDRHRLRQEAVLGLGGMAMLRALGLEPETLHMNEGHSALLVLDLAGGERRAGAAPRGVFTTHTPVPAGHDRFDRAVVEEILGPERTAAIDELGLLCSGELNMTELGIAGSRFVNAVSRRHRDVTREMFPGAEISSVTNGVHAATWVGPSMAKVLDRHLDGWRLDNAVLRYANLVPSEEIAAAHAEAKQRLLGEVADRTGRILDREVLTIGLARRATPYKQTALLFSDLERLTAMAGSIGPVQVLVSGKAHPRDADGKRLITEVVEASRKLSGSVEVVVLEQYGLRLAALLVAGSDVWLNTPLKPNEASGTSGMKAALNGVPSLSTLDGWWIEGCLDGVTGWSVGGLEPGDDAADLYRALESVVLPLYYGDPDRLVEIRRFAIALNGSFFTTERMAREYARLAYGLPVARALPG